jgi:hypothetical protein
VHKALKKLAKDKRIIVSTCIGYLEVLHASMKKAKLYDKIDPHAIKIVRRNHGKP